MKEEISINAILAGDGENKQEYQEMVMSFGIEHLVKFPGWVDAEQKVEIYHQADMMAITSLTDIQPLGILDAFGWGKIVLSSDHIGPMQDVSIVKMLGLVKLEILKTWLMVLNI